MKLLKDTIDMANVFSDRLADLREAVQHLIGRELSVIAVHRKFITKVREGEERERKGRRGRKGGRRGRR